MENFKKIDRITIYSVGLLGASLGLSFKQAGFKGAIRGISSKSATETAVELNCIDEGFTYDQLEKVVQNTDILFLCSPIEVILETIKKLSTMDLPDNLIITDVGSTKFTINKAASESLPENVNFIGGHPMAGSERNGPEAADPFLFQNAIYVISPLHSVDKTIVDSFAKFLEKYLGCRHMFMDPLTHDKITATVSHLPHILSVALVNCAGNIEEEITGTIDLAAGGFKDMTRIASAPYKMWHDIFNTNKDSILSLIDIFSAELDNMRQALINGDLHVFFDRARKIRNKIPVKNKGFISKLFEVTVVIPDTPGMIARTSALLFNEGINLKDIELLKVREGDGGTIKLAFETSSEAKKAIDILNENGFRSREIV